MLISNKVVGFVLKLRETFTESPYSHKVEFKPFPAFPAWKGLFDLTQIDNDIAAAAAAAAAAQETANQAVGIGTDAFANDAINLIPYVMIAPVGSTGFGVPQFLTTVWLNQYSLMSGNGNSAEISVPLKSGRWRFELLVTKGSASGNVRCFVDGVDLGLQVGYNASNLNAMMSWLKTVSETGEHTVKLQIDGKESASTGYSIAASLLVLRREPE